eukprot:10511005-Ditylum_brightwellii.AAC.1
MKKRSKETRLKETSPKRIYIMVYYTPDKIKAKVLHPMLQQVEGEQDYAAINAIMQQLYENVATILSNLGGGAHGHIGLVLQA